MPDKDLNQLETVFHAVLDLPPDAREAYLSQACNGDESLYAEVSSLISALNSGKAFIDEPALSLGLRVLSESCEHSLAGTSIGAYNIISRLGKGGMGEVYLAEDTRLGRKVALKFLSQEFIGDSWARRLLVKEAQAVAMLDHPNICPVYGIEEFGQHTFIVMQHVEGETLADLISKKSITVEQVIPLVRQIVGALAEAHAHSIIHRDIKPRNIMVTSNKQVKVLDFGLAKTVQKPLGTLDDSISNFAGLVPGTVAYMSPEQLRGERLDFRSDLFSVGTVMYELVFGQNPFARKSEAETISNILTADPPPLRNLMPQYHQIEQIVSRCLQKNRDQRYHSASALLLDLDGFTTCGSRQSPSYFRPWIIWSLLLCLIIASMYLYVRQRGVSQSSILPAKNLGGVQAIYSLAVIPVTSENSPNVDDYLCEGLTESLINKFSSLSQLRVRPYTAVSGYKGRAIDPQIVGSELKVDALLLGHVIQRGKQQILQSKLVKTSDGTQIWGGEGEITWQTIFELEDQLAKNVTDTLALRLVDEKTFLARHGTSSTEAFRQYMLGRHYWKNRNEQNINKAIYHFNEAIRLDPLYSRAYAGLADSYVLLSVVSFGKTRTEDAMSRATAAAKEAIAADDNLPEAHSSLGVVDLRYNWDWQNAEKEFKRAIELQNDYAPAHYWYSQLLLITGRREEAVIESEKAKTLDPFSPPSVMNFCRTLSLSRQYEKAISCYDALLLENPKFDHAKYLRALVYQRSGRFDEALTAFQNLYSTNRALAGAALGYAYGRAGKTREAQRVLTEMEALSKERFVPPIEFAIVYIGMGDKDNAFLWLENAFRERFATLPYITVDPIFASLHSDPRFSALVQRLGLPPPVPFKDQIAVSN
jgi:serine/threonine protein kinase/tetratricopeptide (TPR) repeat protein